jgi:hypothetical protein
MNEASGVARKRTFGSPQKTQSSIITFSKKKQNQSQTPERTALTRSFKAITTMNTVSSPPAKSRLNNNPFTPLAKEEENEEEIEEVDNTTPGSQHSTMSTAETYSTYDSTRDPSIVSSPEKKLLSKKALQALRKIRTARIALSDASLREELDGLLDKGIIDYFSQETVGKTLNNVETSRNEDERAKKHEEEEKEVNQNKNVNTQEMEIEIEDGSQAASAQTSQKSREANSLQTPEKSQGSGKSVSFAKAVAEGPTNSQSLRQGGVRNPYAKSTPQLQAMRP